MYIKVEVVYLQIEESEEPAVFPQSGGKFDCLSAGRKYRLCGDANGEELDQTIPAASSTRQLQPVLEVAEDSSAVFSKLSKYRCPASASTAPPPGRSWSALCAAPLASRKHKHKDMAMKEVKNVDYCTLEVDLNQIDGVRRVPGDSNLLGTQPFLGHHY